MNLAERPRREPTQYNLFMKETLAAVKRDNPDLTHREAFRIASGKVSVCNLYRMHIVDLTK